MSFRVSTVYRLPSTVRPYSNFMYRVPKSSCSFYPVLSRLESRVV
jgi:hypothetical protein